jgi:hypothetical protein
VLTHPPSIAADADRHRLREPDVLHAWAGRHDPDGGYWCLRRPRRGRAGNFTPKPLGLNGSYSPGSGPISCAIKRNLDRLTQAATGGRDDRGDADVSGDTDRDPEADARSAYRGTS